MNQPQTLNLIKDATVSNATSWVLTATDVGIDTKIVTIAGIVFTTVNPIGTTAGNVLLGANQAATLTNLTALINDPLTTTSTGVALSAANAATIRRLGITATTTATAMTITSSNKSTFSVSTDETNFAWTSVYTSQKFSSGPIGKVSLQMTRSGHSSGSGSFVVEASNDGSNWATYNKITSNATNTNSQTDVRVASVALSSNTTVLATLPEPYAFYRVVLTITTDGTHQCLAYTS